MLAVTLSILAIFIFFILEDEFAIGIVLAGLLALLGFYVLKMKELGKRIAYLEEKLSGKTTQQKPESRVASSADPWLQPHSPDVNDDIDQPASLAEDQPSTEEKKPAAAYLRTHDPVKAQSIEPVKAAQAATPKPSVEPAKAQKKPIMPSAPAIAAGPRLIEKLVKSVWNWFTDGNVFVRIGIIVLFMGMTFLIRYAIGENLIPIELRLAAVSAVAIALLFWGWRQRKTRPAFSLVIQGGGVGLLYLTIFAGFSLYHVIPSTFAFVLLALTVILAAMLAIYQDAKALALFATIGGFLAPVLTSSGSNNYIGLFSYYTVLNLGVFAVAWFKSWRILNFVGFLFTFAISTIWGALSYQPEFFSTTEPFLIIFFLLYVAIGILYAHKRTPSFNDYVDSSIIFGTPLLAFGLQCALVKDYEYGIAISAATLAAFYLTLSNVLWNKYANRLRLLSETFLSLGVIFATLAIPFAIDGSLTGATWAIEGAGILWISIKQQQKYRRLFATILIFASGFMLASELIFPLGEPRVIFNYAFTNSVFIGCLIIAISASCSSWLLSREFPGKLEIEKTASYGLLAYGLLVLLSGFEYQIYDFELHTLHGSLLAVLSGICVIAYTIAANKLKWQLAHWVSLAFIAAIAVAAVLCYAYQPQLAMHYGYVIWPLTLVAYFYGLKQALNTVMPRALMAAHILAAFIIVCLLFWEGLWQLLLCYSLLAILFNLLSRKLEWPQLKILALGFLPVLVLCSIAAIVIDGDLIRLSSIAADMYWPFPPGYVLWPSGFAVFFYLLHQNQKIAGHSTRNLHRGGALLIAALLVWLGLWPLLLGASLLSVLSCYLWRRLSWAEMRITSMALLPLMLLIIVLKLFSNNFDPFDLQAFNVDIQTSFELGYLLWPLGFGVMFWSYKQYDQQQQSAPAWLHGPGLLLLAWLITWEASWHVLDIVDVMNAWHLALLPLASMLAIVMIKKPLFWPFTQHSGAYHRYALLPLILVLTGWCFLQLLSSGSSLPLPWLPLINPVDIVLVIIFIMGILYWDEKLLSFLHSPPSKQNMTYALLAFIFLWANVDLLRGVHHWADINWQMPTIVNSAISQTALSLFWALTGLATTLYASRKFKRGLWISGATLLGVVVIKLFLIDLSAQETIERIVSFTGVGLLLMFVGYFSPLPPRKAQETGKPDHE